MSSFEIPVKVVVLQDRNATVAAVVGDTGEIVATGSAKRAPGDPFVSQAGVVLATARALQAYGYKLEDSLF